MECHYLIPEIDYLLLVSYLYQEKEKKEKERM